MLIYSLLTSRSTLGQHLSWQSVESRLIFADMPSSVDWFIWVSQHSTNSRSSANWVSIKMSIKCQSIVEWVSIEISTLVRRCQEYTWSTQLIIAESLNSHCCHAVWPESPKRVLPCLALKLVKDRLRNYMCNYLTLFSQLRFFSTELLCPCSFQEIVSGEDANTGACLLFALNPKTSKMICLECFSLEQR